MGVPEQAEKRREHFALAKAPDWKYTPLKPNRGVPVPYWTIAYFDKAKSTAASSDGRANEYFIARSRAPISNGGEAGKGKGVLTNAYMDEFEPKEWSDTLIIESHGAVFQGHMGTINKGNAPAKVYTNVNPDVAIADKACWEQLKTNMAALGVATKDKMFADPTGCGQEMLSGAWGTISGDVAAVGDMLGSIWGGITAFFSDPLGSMSSAAEGLKKFGTQAYEAGKQVAGIVQGLRDGSITMEDLMDFAADMLQDQLCAMAAQVEEMVKSGKGCEAMGVILGQTAEAVAVSVATAGVGAAAGAGGKAAQLMAKAGIGKGDDIAAMIRKLKDFKKKNKEKPHAGKDHTPPRDPHSTDSSTPGDKKSDPCPLCPTVGNPVNPVLGVKLFAGAIDLDFDLPAPMPLPWQRTYVSSNPHAGWLGQGWTLPFSTRINERRTARGLKLVLTDEFGRDISFPQLPPGADHYNEFEQITLRALDDGQLQLSGNDGAQRLLFAPLPATGKSTLRRYALQAILDRNDNAIRITYGDHGLPSRITDSAGRVLALDFTALDLPAGARQPAHRLTHVALLLDAEGRQRQTLVGYRYDEAGNLVAVLDRLGLVRRQFEYRHHMLVAHSHAGVRVQYHYDFESPRGRVLSSESSTGESYTFEYLKGHTRVTDQLGRVETYEYNKDKEWTATVDALGGRTERELDALGNLIALTDAAGRTTRYTYDGQGRPVRIQSPGSTALEPMVLSVRYDEALGLPIAVTDPAGGTTQHRYDVRGNLVETVDALGQRTHIAYDSRGLPTSITDALGKTKHLAYNAAGQLTRYTDCSGRSTDYTYDGWGNLTRTTDALGQTTRYQHDPLHRLQAVQYPDGGSERFEYDEAGRLVAHIDPLDARTEYTLAADGKPLARTNALGGELRYEYDAARRLRTLFNENNARYDFVHDPLDRLVEETGFDGRQSLYHYDPTGLVLAKLEPGCLTAEQRLEQRQARERSEGTRSIGSTGSPHTALPPQRTAPTFDDPWGLGLLDESVALTPPPGHTIATRYVRDAAGRLVHKQVAGHVLDAQEHPQAQHRSTRYRYSAAGQLIEATNDAGSRSTLAYDLLGQLVEESRTGQGITRTLRHSYDALGNRIQTQLPDGGELNWLHYGSGHLHQINLDGRVICDMERDALHREVQRSQGALQSRYRYDAMGRLSAQAAWRVEPAGQASVVTPTAPGTHPAPRPGAWEALGDEVNPQAGRVQGPALLGRRYQYDRAGNLQGIDDLKNGVTRYGYDKIGRILSASQPNLQERFAFDPAHNMLPVSQTQAPTGNATAANVSTGLIKDNRLEVFEDKRYRYDSHGNLIEKKTGKHTTLRLVWDVEHQLAEAIVTRHGSTQTTRYTYDAFGRRLSKQDTFGQTLFEWDGNRLLSERRGSQQTLYVYEADSFAPLAQVRLGASSDLEKEQPIAQVEQGQAAIKLEEPEDEEDWQPRKTAAVFEAQMLAQQKRLQAQVRGEVPEERPPEQEAELNSNVVHLQDWKVRYYHNDHLGTPRELSGEDGRIVWQARESLRKSHRDVQISGGEAQRI
jgi:YD repeat-containing protein